MEAFIIDFIAAWLAGLTFLTIVLIGGIIGQARQQRRHFHRLLDAEHRIRKFEKANIQTSYASRRDRPVPRDSDSVRVRHG